MCSSQTIEKDKLAPLRGGVALVQHLKEATPFLYVQTEDNTVSYTLQEKISKVFYKYIRTGLHTPGFPQDIYVIL